MKTETTADTDLAALMLRRLRRCHTGVWAPRWLRLLARWVYPDTSPPKVGKGTFWLRRVCLRYCFGDMLQVGDVIRVDTTTWAYKGMSAIVTQLPREKSQMHMPHPRLRIPTRDVRFDFVQITRTQAMLLGFGIPPAAKAGDTP